MPIWKKLNQDQVKERIFSALEKNVNYFESNILGIPASHLDGNVFYQDAPFLNDAPFFSTLLHNPNHIGCHTLGTSESFFSGTQEIEREVIQICANEILKGGDEDFDGYIASGGTEANMQAIWIYRNYFKKQFNAKAKQICILTSSDSHYSMAKGSNVFSIDILKVNVGKDDRKIKAKNLEQTIEAAKKEGKKYFIVVANMMTTMFGSVDNVSVYADTLKELKVNYKIHIDGAFGGFYYPFTQKNTKLNFSNPEVSSITLDAHKMAQAPYGTGIFLARKGLMQYANTEQMLFQFG
jgi:glutamate/tyrosine decarboxylase-like PLP-dependent enzyme